MKNKGVKQLIICDLIAGGLDFNKNAFELSTSEKTMLAERAKECNYKRPAASYFGLGGAFFLHLQKIFRSDRLLQEDLKQFIK